MWSKPTSINNEEMDKVYHEIKTLLDNENYTQEHILFIYKYYNYNL